MPYSDKNSPVAIACRKRAQKKYREKHKYDENYKEQRRKYQREAYQKNPQKFLARNKLWRLNNSDKLRESHKKWYEEHKKNISLEERKRHREAVRRYRIRNPNAQKNRRMKQRMIVLTHYGGDPPKCTCCSEFHIEFLTVDHIHGNGIQHRKIIGNDIYPWLIKNNFPEGYQILCWNCQFGKEYPINQVEYNLKIKLEVLTRYGGNPPKCACCGHNNIRHLALDHIKNDGNDERRKTKTRGGFAFYLWLRKNGYPSGYRVLCHNCNSSLGLYGYCPHKNFV